MPPEVDAAAKLLERYATRGVFQGFSQAPGLEGRGIFKVLWHRNRHFELILDVAMSTLRFPLVLPEVPAKSPMYRDLQEFVKSRQSGALPDHRRIDPAKATVKVGNRGGSVSVTLTVNDGDLEYGVRKIVALVHEIFLVFLLDGNYYEYMVDKFDLDPDRL